MNIGSSPPGFGSIASSINYDAAPEERFYVFIIPEIVGFICAGLMMFFGKLKKSNIS
jgi:hypothetical protein